MLHQHPGGLDLTQRLIDGCAFPTGAKVVDVGCGTGTTIEYLQDYYGLDVVGVDVSETRLEQGRKRSPRLALIQGNSEHLPFADVSVHGALAECSLSVMRHTGKVVSEISRILMAGGKLGITDLYVRNPDDPFPDGHLPQSGCHMVGTGDRDLVKLLEKNHLRTVVWEDHSGLLQEFVARYIMECGPITELWQCIPENHIRTCSKQSFARAKLGYFLLVAEKQEVGR